MKIHQVAPGLLRLALMSPDHTNVYLAGEVLIDAGGRFSAKKILSALTGRTVAAHALTHAHFDHKGGSHAICQALKLPLWCGAGDRAAVESGNLLQILQEPFAWATFDVEQNRASARKLAALKPKVVCFGHGAHSAGGDGFQRFVAGLSNP